jgi:hypothetical protein
MGLASLARAASAEATEAWTWSHSVIVDPLSGNNPPFGQPEVTRFELSPPDLVYDQHQRRYHIVQNDDYALVAAASISQIKEGQGKPTVGAWTFAINKMTGELGLAVVWAAVGPFTGQAVHRTCLKD